MTVSSSTNRNQYSGNGATTTFARTFLVNDADHLKVYQTISGVTTEVTSGITKTGIGSASGNVVFDTAPATGTTITLIREVPLTQETDYSAQGAVSPEQVEDDLDLAAMRVQDVQEQLDRSVKLPVSSALSGLELPPPFAGRVIGWNSGGDGLVNIASLAEVTLTMSTNNGVPRYSGGNLINSAVTIDASDNMAVPGGALTVGADDVTGGTLTLFGKGTGAFLGGEIVVHTAADHDSNVVLYRIVPSGEDLRFRAEAAGGGDVNLAGFDWSTDSWDFEKPVVFEQGISITGTVTGDVVLPQATWEAGTSTTEGVVSPVKVKAAVDSQFNVSGSAPKFACRAWVNFNGTGTVAIRESGNVSSITDNGTGDYTVNFETAMPDANYAVIATCANTLVGGSTPTIGVNKNIAPTTTAVRLFSHRVTSGNEDSEIVSVAIFR